MPSVRGRLTKYRRQCRVTPRRFDKAIVIVLLDDICAFVRLSRGVEVVLPFPGRHVQNSHSTLPGVLVRAKGIEGAGWTATERDHLSVANDCTIVAGSARCRGRRCLEPPKCRQRKDVYI
jgi:hypothetical protein